MSKQMKGKNTQELIMMPKHRQTIEKLNKLLKCITLPQAKYNSGTLKIIF